MIKRLLKGNLNDIAQVPITEQDDVEIVDFPGRWHNAHNIKLGV